MSNVFTPHRIRINNSIRQVKVGIEPDSVTIGNESAMPFVPTDGELPNKPVIAVEIPDIMPNYYPEILLSSWGKAVDNHINLAVKAKELGAELIALRLASIKDNQDNFALSIEKAKEIFNATKLPMIILGINNREKDSKALKVFAEKLSGFNCLIGPVEEDTYKNIVPACRDNGHCVIARTPIDVNLAKQLNILISELGMSPDKIVIDPNMGGLGYGLDYAYSVVEKIRNAAFDGDKMLNMPIVVFTGEETWRTKEAKSDIDDPYWGNPLTRGTMWEMITTSSMLMTGADIVVMRHPTSIQYIYQFIKGIKI